MIFIQGFHFFKTDWTFLQYITGQNRQVMKLKGVSQVAAIQNATQCGELIWDEVLDTITGNEKRDIAFIQQRFQIKIGFDVRIQVFEELKKRFSISRSKRLWIKNTGYHLGG